MSTSVGNQAESAAIDFLKMKGFKLVERNWRTRVCEIDIVAEKDGTLYLIEVKYRRNGQQGSGLDYITNKKLQQMMFAASCWAQEHNWEDSYELAAIEVASNFKVTHFIESLT